MGPCGRCGTPVPIRTGPPVLRASTSGTSSRCPSSASLATCRLPWSYTPSCTSSFPAGRAFSSEATPTERGGTVVERTQVVHSTPPTSSGCSTPHRPRRPVCSNSTHRPAFSELKGPLSLASSDESRLAASLSRSSPRSGGQRGRSGGPRSGR